MMRYLFLYLFILSTTLTIAQAQQTPNAIVEEEVNKMQHKKWHPDVVLIVDDTQQQFAHGVGALQTETPYFIASTTKLFVVTLILKLTDEHALQLDDPISKYLSADILNGLHTYKGVDYASSITIRHLLAQTSGLPNYFSDKGASGKSLEHQLLHGHDQQWTAEEAIAISKTMQPKFAPGTPGKAYYSDTNYQLLGLILKAVTQKSFNQLIQERICVPLNMQTTYVYSDTADHKPLPLRYKQDVLQIPLAMATVTTDGGIVSTAADMQLFLQAFMKGKLFNAGHLFEMMQWNPIFSPFNYGLGLMQFTLPKIATLGAHTPKLIGHSGLSGAFAFYDADSDTYLTGTVNQLAKRSDSFKLMVRVMMR